MIDRQKCCRSHNVNLKVIVGTYLLNGWSVSCTYKSYWDIPGFLGTWIPRFLDPYKIYIRFFVVLNRTLTHEMGK